MRKLIEYKRIGFRDCLRLPHEWGKIAWLSYGIMRKRAEREQPPGYNVLWVGVLQSLISKDRFFIDKAMELVKHNISDDEVFSLTGKALYSIGYTDEGIYNLRKALEIKPSIEKISALLIHLDKPEDFTEKLYLCFQILNKDPDNLTAIINSAFILLRFNRINEANKYINISIKKSPKNPDARLGLAEILYVKNDPENALHEYKKALHYGCKDKKLALLKISCCYYFLNEFKKAKKTVMKILKKQPGYKFAKQVLSEIEGSAEMGVQYYKNGLTDQAYPWLKIETKIEVQPGEATLFLSLIEMERTNNVSHVDTALKIIGDHLPEDFCLNTTGDAKCRMGFAEEGINDLRKAVSINSNIENVSMLAHHLSQMNENKAEAKELFLRVLEKDEDNTFSLTGLANLEDNQEEALKLHLRAVEINPNEWRSHCNLGKNYYRLGKYDEALNCLNKARTLIKHENPCDISICTSRCYLKMNNNKYAKKYSEYALLENPDSDEAKQLHKELGNIKDSRRSLDEL